MVASMWMISETVFDCWTTRGVLGCVVMLLGLLNAFGIIQSVQGQDAAESRFAAPATEVEISLGSEPEEVAPRSLSFEMASMEAAPQIPRCTTPNDRIWMHLSEGDTCIVSYACPTYNIPGPYLYIHHGNPRNHHSGNTAERGKDVLITGPDSVLITVVNGIRSHEGITDIYEAIPDGIPEGDEEMLCYCSAYRDGPGEYEFGHPVQIKDRDGWTVHDATAYESQGQMIFLLEFPQPVARDLTVEYSTKNGSAEAGTDYTSTKGSVTVRKGHTGAYIGVPLVKDQIPEGTETFELLTISDQFSAILEQKATGTILEGAPFIIEPSPLFVDEGGQNTYTMALGNQPGGDVMVAITGHTGTDLALDKTSLTFTPANWDQRQTVTVTAAEDADTIDDGETLIHTATAPGGFFDGLAESLWVTITDKDLLGLIVTPNHLDLVEGGSGQAFEVKLGSSPSVGTDVTVAVNVGPQLDGKVSVSEPHLIFTSTTWSTDQSVTVTAESDGDADDEAGLVQLSASGGGYGGISGAVKVSVADDDVPYRIDIEPSSVQVSEDAGLARFKVRLNRQNETAVTVRYTTHDESAHAGLDYLGPVTDMLTFEAGGNLEKWIDVPILDDALHEGEETFTLELTDVQGAELGVSTGRATILDNDAAPTVSIVPTLYVREGGTAKVHVRLRKGSATPIGVLYSTSDVTATAGDDYEAVSAGSLTIEPGDMGAVIQVPTEDDALHEGREAFLVQLDGGGKTTVTILDNDRLPQLSIGDVTVSEDGGGAQLAVSLSGPSPVRVGVAYATQDGTAKAGADYTRTIGTLVFAPGEIVRHVSVPVLRDDVVEEDEGLVVKLSAPEHAVLLDAEGDVTIKDDPLEVSIHDGTGTESSDELVMAVRLNYGSTKVVSVQFAVTGGTATLDVDYEATQGLVVFETGSTEAQVRIPLIDDDLQEGNETIEVTLSNPTNTQIGQAMATGTVVDDETAPGVQVRAIAVSHSEAVFVVRLQAPVAERLTGRFRTVDGTAWAGEDYERMEGVLEFGPGETRKEVRVPLLRAQGSGEAFALMVELGDETVREEVVLGTEDTGTRARLGRSVAVHIVEAVSERMEGSLVGCMPRPFPGQRVRASHLLSGCGMQASGERLSIWGRGAYSRLQSGGVSGADVVTASLGADYRAGGRWLMGMVVSRSEALEQEGTLLQMTGWYPYVRYGGMRHSVWGLAGAGQGVAEAADTGMRLMAAGVGGTLVRRTGARLGYEADGIWLGMDGGIGVSRVRAGLEGSVTLQDILEPYVEAAVLHSGGDAERGMGMEAGGGLRVRMGMLHAEVMSRRLVLHQEDGYGEWGYSGMVRYGGLEGLGAQVRPTWGRTHVGTLWQAERPWEVYPSDRRMELEVGYGSRVHRRSVLRPHVGMGLRDRGRDYRIGAGVQGRTGLGFSVSGLAMEHMAPYRPVSYGVTASGYVRW